MRKGVKVTPSRTNPEFPPERRMAGVTHHRTLQLFDDSLLLLLGGLCWNCGLSPIMLEEVPKTALISQYGCRSLNGLRPLLLAMLICPGLALLTEPAFGSQSTESPSTASAAKAVKRTIRTI